MTFKKRLTAAALAAGLIFGGTIVAAAPAQAAQGTKVYYSYTGVGYLTKAQCQTAELAKSRSISNAGGRIYAGDGCAVRGSVTKWAFTIKYWKLIPAVV